MDCVFFSFLTSVHCSCVLGCILFPKNFLIMKMERKHNFCSQHVHKVLIRDHDLTANSTQRWVQAQVLMRALITV